MENVTDYFEILGNVTTENGISTGYISISVDPLFTPSEEIYSLPIKIIICVVLSIIIMVTIAGNVFVIAAILLEKSLRGVSNYLIMSLAVTDLMVAILVMPISVVHEVTPDWNFGGAICDMWISFDVLCCTASILHLVAIAFDRYWAVSNIDYIRRRCAKLIGCMVVAVWVVSVSISIPPLFGWKDDNDPDITKRCLISQDLGYTIFSTLGAFYFPLILMLVLNIKIYVAARTRIRKKGFYGYRRPVPVSAITVTMTEGQNLSPNSSGSDISHERYSAYNGSCMNMNELTRVNSVMELTDERESAIQTSPTTATTTATPASSTLTLTAPTGRTKLAETSVNQLSVPSGPKASGGCRNLISSKNQRQSANGHVKRLRQRERERVKKEKIEMKRERKAARVIAIITGGFMACWLPFFMVALIGPFCKEYCYFPPVLMSLFLWLGYLNSLLNPIIYTIFNPSFRTAFKKLIYGKYRMRSQCR
ncbi:5-hydroxytryptamine receptor 1B [Octopus bimaculoides]|uniref:G-protein coupled receptors family 1 profile domain-containing protein n=1 Tax=Octopus bimaculoides TaxID=37653 RepID=A0A0L8H2L3_OCTBM|nr:5-hydroxytryptamine receptor 1B [Octopus bimaculoides]XP_014776020.1 5-hydroxytryptamine receptor 1B [Octopus bimaculoides]|eukprot:XP_014776019.1 PREDICTED: 5-hydroxytryptamine receptor 1B-like [Octopus bimaculoides]